jgi:hypothetical protein
VMFCQLPSWLQHCQYGVHTNKRNIHSYNTSHEHWELSSSVLHTYFTRLQPAAESTEAYTALLYPQIECTTHAVALVQS